MFDRSFVCNVYVLTTKNINRFSLERKIFDVKNRAVIHMFWEDCKEPSFYKHICKPENFMYLNGKNVIYPRVAEIVHKYIEKNKENFDKLKKKLIKNKKIFQFVYSSAYHEVYSFVEKRGIELRNNFLLKFKDWKDKKKYLQKSIEGYFSKSESSPQPPVGAIQKKLVTDDDFENEKKLAEEQKQREMEEKKQKKRE